ncbi:UDP-N-acetylmuramate dehydrogenase [Paraglaciecola sp. 20A4]|uniref:UDP-N-acetylmuramate dehydrogenase n=1 Tax=Paraglaciecola sp. 20A4 TaxID=2687288 RepID=UPI00140C5878|nr:UDP-N-acetylmuramate dehydrogenase [Paraglaciecola sp. 20A4]
MKSLQQRHTFGLPASSNDLVCIHSLSDAHDFVEHHNNAPFYLLGQGSNTAFIEDYEGTVVEMALKGITVSEDDSQYTLNVAAGESWHQLVIWCLQHNIRGFENLALIPGTVGAAPIQNIGAYGVEIERFIQSVQYIDYANNQFCHIARKDCAFGYRDSIFKKKLWHKVMIVGVTFSLPKSWRPVVTYGELATLNAPSAQDIFNKVVAVRQAKLPDPKILGNAGSFFKNPIISRTALHLLQQRFSQMPYYEMDLHNVKIPAGWLIEQLGFKGQQEGDIRCHPKQALVLTNLGEGTGTQLLTLARKIKQAVEQQFNIALEHEVQLIGAKGTVLL